ncbi:hypothetical protein TrRE_jg9022 [Triparma retinervis]|uniref:Uncharacterized protein n=1 Tax=Triparma retinervis TaxID=2557542 RepID=A0A9W7A1I3_9STRA|nr:hypothetical protein TrRE_jg9022 [Triparma retinervis]
MSLQPNNVQDLSRKIFSQTSTYLRNNIPSAFDFYIGKSVEMSLPDLKIDGGGTIKVDGKLDLSMCAGSSMSNVSLIVGRGGEVKVPKDSKFASLFVDGSVVGDVEGTYGKIGAGGKVFGVLKVVTCEVDAGGWVKSIEIVSQQLEGGEEEDEEEGAGLVAPLESEEGREDLLEAFGSLGGDIEDDYMSSLKEALDGMAELQKGLEENAAKAAEAALEVEEVVEKEEEMLEEEEMVEEEVVFEEPPVYQVSSEIAATTESTTETATETTTKTEGTLSFDLPTPFYEEEEEEIIYHPTDSFGNPLVPGIGRSDLKPPPVPTTATTFTPPSFSALTSPMLTRGEPTLKDAFDQPLVGSASPEGVEMFKKNRDEMRQARELMDSMRQQKHKDRRVVGKVDLSVGETPTGAQYNPYKVADITRDILARGRKEESTTPTMAIQEDFAGEEFFTKSELEEEAKQIAKKNGKRNFKRFF